MSVKSKSLDSISTVFHVVNSRLRGGPRPLAMLATLLIPGIAFISPSCAQNYSTSTGQPSFSAPQPVELGFVDASTGNLHLSIPIGSYQQRSNSQSETITLEYDSNIWGIYTYGSLVWEPYNTPGPHTYTGWYFSFQAGAQNSAGSATVQGCWEDWPWTDQQGTVHVFHLNSSGNSGCMNAADAYATDSSGYHAYETYTTNSAGMTISTTKIFAPDGTLVALYSNDTSQELDSNGHYIYTKDSNGNYLSTDQFTPMSVYDTLGRQIVSVAYPNTTVMTSQGTSSYSISGTLINVKTNFQQTSGGVTVQETSTQLNVIRSLTLPDAAHSTYYFIYDCDQSSGNPACGSPSGQSAYYGELIGITLPTGGQVHYSYTTFTDAYQNKSRWVSSRSAANGSWSYTPQVLSTCSLTQVNCKQQTTVTSPTDQTVYTFQLNNGAWPISVVQSDLSGHTLSSISNTWDMSQSCVLIGCHGDNFIRLSAQKTIISTAGGSLTKQTSYTYDSPQAGNRTAIKEWKYSSSGSFASVPDRATYTNYLTTGTNNINRPTSVTLCNNSGSSSACPGGGSMVSQTLYSYDGYGTGGLSNIAGVAQHDDTSFGTGYTTRGNVTSVSRWVSGSSYLTTSYTYDTTGQVLTETDPAGYITHYGYGDSFFTDAGNDTTPSLYAPSQPTNAYLTSVSDVIGTQTAGYYWGSGDIAVQTDYNNSLTTRHYQDGLDQQTEEVDPIGWGLATYSSPTQSDVYNAVGDASASIACSSCQHTQSILDEYGRTVSSISVNNPIGQVNIDSTYNSAGQLQSQSHPYSGSSDPNHVFETFSYDAVGRTTSITHPDGEAQQSAFGTIVGVLEGITSQQGSASTYGYGYPQISEDESGHQRQEWIDGFGQIVEVDEPSATSESVATTTISIVSGGGSEWESIDPCEPYSSCPQTIPNSGTVSLTVDGYTETASYGQNGPYPSFEAASDVASALASALNTDPNSPVNATASGTSIVLAAKGPGTSGDFTFSSSTTYYTQSCPPYNPCFGGPVFVISPSSGSLSGGSGGVSSSPYYTNYIYDAADHLTKVIQGVQTRTFAYDGLGRKVSETTPEGGTVTYSYNTSGGGLCSGDPSNVCQRTDARGVVATYAYNSANQLSGVAYSIPSGVSAMPNVCTTSNGTSANVCYYYGQGGAQAYALGRLTEVVDPTGSESYSHDADGRVTQVSKVINGQTFNIGYQYDPGGDVTQITYPSGRVVHQAYNAIGQLCQIDPTATSCNGNGYYAYNFTYNAPGNLTGFSYGNGVTAAFTYSANRTQLSALAYAKAASTYFSQQYWYQQNSQSCSNGTTGNNGSIQCIADLVDSGRTVNYGYDTLGRLISAKTNGSTAFPQWGLAESYDRYGNRPSQTVTAGSGPQTSLSYNSNNQPVGYTFDPSGNMTVEPLSPPNDMTYDGENRMTAFSGWGGAATYSYDGNGLRVVKSVAGGTTTVSIFSGNSVIAEYDNGAAPSSPSREYIYNPAGGATTGLLAMVSGGTTTYYHQDDQSVRLTTDGNGNIVTQDGSFPFGEAWYQSGSVNKWLFTSYQRDSESGLDYALARYYDSRTGSFCSADPLAGDPSDPQSWNRYPYGRNDPITITDSSGKNWLFSLMQDIGLILAPFTGGATLPMAEAGATMNGFDNLANGQPPWSFGSFGGSAYLGTSWNGTPIMPDPGLTAGIQGAIGLPTMADVGGPIFDAQNGAVTPGGLTTCYGWATIRGVGGKQATAKGALYSDYPQLSGGSIKGGTFGTVAVQRGFLGLNNRQLRTYGTQISISPAFSSANSTQFGGPAGPWTVSDYGDAHIQATKGVAFDLYRFPTVKKGNQFGKANWPVAIRFPKASGGHCPPGYTVAK